MSCFYNYLHFTHYISFCFCLMVVEGLRIYLKTGFVCLHIFFPLVCETSQTSSINTSEEHSKQLTIYEDSNVKNSDCNMFTFKKGVRKVCGRLFIYCRWVACCSKWWWNFGLLLKVLCFWTLTFHLKQFGEKLRYLNNLMESNYFSVCCITAQKFWIIYAFINILHFFQSLQNVVWFYSGSTAGVSVIKEYWQTMKYESIGTSVKKTIFLTTLLIIIIILYKIILYKYYIKITLMVTGKIALVLAETWTSVWRM